MSTQGGSDRHREPRFEIGQAIEVAFARESFFQAVGLNISRTGILCETNTRLDTYTRVQLVINLDYDGELETVNCEGMVMRIEEAGDRFHVGIKFTDMPEYLKAELSRYVDSLEETGGEGV